MKIKKGTLIIILLSIILTDHPFLSFYFNCLLSFTCFSCFYFALQSSYFLLAQTVGIIYEDASYPYYCYVGAQNIAQSLGMNVTFTYVCIVISFALVNRVLVFIHMLLVNFSFLFPSFINFLLENSITSNSYC